MQLAIHQFRIRRRCGSGSDFLSIPSKEYETEFQGCEHNQKNRFQLTRSFLVTSFRNWRYYYIRCLLLLYSPNYLIREFLLIGDRRDRREVKLIE